MLLIKGIDYGLYQAYCTGCGCRTDVVDDDYLSWFLSRRVKGFPEEHLCHDCDAESDTSGDYYIFAKTDECVMFIGNYFYEEAISEEWSMLLLSSLPYLINEGV